MYSLDGRLSLQSLSELETSRSWITEITAPSTQQPTAATLEDDGSDSNPRYMGISLPRKLTAIFPESTPSEILREKVNKSRPIFESKRTQVRNIFINIDLDNNNNKLYTIDTISIK